MGEGWGKLFVCHGGENGKGENPEKARQMKCAYLKKKSRTKGILRKGREAGMKGVKTIIRGEADPDRVPRPGGVVKKKWGR